MAKQSHRRLGRGERWNVDTGEIEYSAQWLADNADPTVAYLPVRGVVRVSRPAVAEPPQALDLVQKVFSAGRESATATLLLQRVCDAFSEAFGFDHVTAARYQAGSEEVTEVASAGIAEGASKERRSVGRVPLLVEAIESRALVLRFGGSNTSVTLLFALPLMGSDGCLGFLFGDRHGTVASATEAEALAIAGAAAAALFENALIREKLEHGDALKSEFVALAAHELRDPLSSVYGIAVTLDERGDTLSAPDRLALQQALREQATRTRSVVEQLLDLSRFDLDGIHVSPERLLLLPKIEALVRSHPHSAAGRVQVAVPPELELMLDPTALDRILSNLIANALRYGEPPVSVTAARRDTHLRLAVEDRGHGVDPELVPRLFDRFTRGREPRSGGSGLGLAIAQAYARAHGGDIVYQPAVPHGARFEVVLPLRPTLAMA